MKTCFTEVFDDVLLRSAETLFANRGIAFNRTIDKLDLRGDERHVGGRIAFEGSTLKGSLLLISTFQTASKMRAPHGPHTPLSNHVAANWIVIRDWTGELANQLIGRIKNRLQPFGVDFQIGAPVLLSGLGLTLALTSPSRTRGFTYCRGDDLVRIVIELLKQPLLASVRPVTGLDEAALEGDVIEF